MTHHLKLVNKMCKFEMDPVSIVQDTEQTLFGLQTNGQMDGRIDRQADRQSKTSIRPLNFVGGGGGGGGGEGGGIISTSIQHDI